ncbi:TRAF3-interacting protein 1-like isoform X2 [Abrus precatorius]|uniref:TRAF3-interacting protein 1-like isoform X2 n=1 Tax=Abrus precatorius TaxID=3816 RepID=A0A8B8JTH6_ABRPR|nr:TRAF3-interacting protein 1-like isoform X2 [Abrus precatorius]
MSRCFPFPPPGYEKKTRTDDLDLLKKDKKEKHREKKKDKDKDRDKDKSKISAADEKGFPGQAQGPNASKLHQKEIKPNDKKGVLFDDKLTKQYAGNNGEKARENNHLVEENRDSKFLLELDRRIRNNDGGAGNQLVHKFTTAEHRKDEETVRLVAKGSGTWPDGKDRLQDKGNDSRKIDGRGIWAEARPIGNAAVQNHAGNFHPRVDQMPRSLEKNFDKTLETTFEGKERVKEKKDDKQGEKRKDKEKEKKGHGKDKDRDKEKKKEEKAKENAEHKNREQNKLKESNKAGPLGSNSYTQVSKHSHENSIVGENLKKRKDIESNGVLHANDNWPSKLLKPSPSDLLTENGRILEPCQISLLNASDKLGAASNVKVDKKERKVNGIIEALPTTVSSNKTPTATIPADPVSEASTKPPHPDTKYLSQVYTVPKADEWSDFDDQEWLSGSSCLQEKKPVVKSSEVGDSLQVWAEAVHIEPADIFALPYVIPY